MSIVLTAADVAQLWNDESLSLTEDQCRILPGLIRWLERRKADPFSCLLRGRPIGQNLAPEEGEQLARRVLARFRPMSSGVEALRIVCKVVDRGNSMKLFKQCPPPIPFLIRRQPSPFAEIRWTQRDIAPSLRRHLSDTLRDSTKLRLSGDNKKKAQVMLGRAMLSAILHGGVLHEEVLESIGQRIAFESSPIGLWGNRVFLELPLGYRGQGSAEFRRWFPDEQSALLLLGVSGEPARRAIGILDTNKSETTVADESGEVAAVSRRQIWNCIRAYLRASGFQAATTAKTLHALLNAVLLDLETRLPPILTNYAARSYISHSLKPEAWARINGEPQRNVGGIRAIQEDNSAALRMDLSDTSEPEPRWLQTIRTCCSSPTRKEIIHLLNAKLDSRSDGFDKNSNGELFARFALYLFTKRNSSGSQLAVSTAKAYTISVSKRLAGILGGTCATDLSGPEWIELYKDALDDVESQGNRRKLARMLWKLHDFLESYCHLEPVNASEALGIGSGLVPVDANIITPDEFFKIRERFASELAVGPLAGIEDIAWLIITLAYRCGLRRMEVLKLELADACLAEPAELLVRPTEARRLKTKNATRKLPLHALLEPEELERLKKFVESRTEEEQRQPFATFLFSAPKRDFRFVPQETMFDTLHTAMRETTGDQTLRFHHLRHSFASWTFYRLMVGDLPGGIALESLGKRTEEYVSQARTFRSGLYGNSNPTRRHGFAITSLLGHSGPDISFEHYVHTVDLVLAHYLADDVVAPERASVTAASGLPATTANRIWKKGTPMALVLYRLERWHKKEKDSVQRSIQDDPASAADEITSLPRESGDVARLNRIWNMLSLHAMRGLSAGTLADRSGDPEDVISGYLARAKEIADMRYQRKGASFRHRMRMWKPDKRQSDELVRIPVPFRPISGSDERILGELAPCLYALHARRPGLVRDVIRHYIENASRESNVLIFKDPEKPKDAQRFLEFLRELGFTKSRLRFVCYDASSRSRVWPIWRKVLSISWRDRQDQLPAPNGRKEKGLPWAGIQPLFENDSGSQEGSPAFRYLLIMAAIEIGWS